MMVWRVPETVPSPKPNVGSQSLCLTRPVPKKLPPYIGEIGTLLLNPTPSFWYPGQTAPVQKAVRLARRVVLPDADQGGFEDELFLMALRIASGPTIVLLGIVTRDAVGIW